MTESGESEDIEVIKAEIRKFPHKEFYPGLFEDLRKINEQLEQRAALRSRSRNAGTYRERADQSLKAHLIQQWRRQQRRSKNPAA